MTIIWINCSERMPPDDDTVIIISLHGDVWKVNENVVHDFDKVSNISWTPYTEEAWSELTG